MKLSNEEILLMDPVEVYKLRIDGTINRFPKNFFSIGGVVKIEVCTKIIKYLIEEKLSWNEEEICQKLSQQIFYKNGLRGMLMNIFNGSPYEAIENVYPDKFKPWQFMSVPNSYWTIETGKEAVKWLIEEKLKWDEKQICQKVSVNVFYDNGLIGMLNAIFHNSPYEAIECTYPGKFKPWQLPSVPNSYWTIETGKEAIKWLIEEKLKWDEEQLCKKVSVNVFYENGLTRMLWKIFNGSPYEAIECIYPGKFKKVGKKIEKV